MRVRFAPSPTGDLHIGGLRTALYNFLLARKTGGTLVLRVEDTDPERSKKEFEERIMEDLRWLGVEWDEGPDVGGDYGPYRQSERMGLYRELLDRLFEEGKVYPCFCSKRELEVRSRLQRARGLPPKYDRKCLKLSEDERRRLMKEKPYSLRFFVEEGPPVTWEDEIKGRIVIERDEIEDFVVMRPDGLPTFHFVNVVDDATMKISLVLRGEDHLTNTAKHILLYRALGFEPPKFGHLPMIMSSGGKKMSKREGGFSTVRGLREEGFLREAILNYTAVLGWSHPEGKEVLSLDELIESFSLDRVSSASPVHDPRKLEWFNRRWLLECSSESLNEQLEDFAGERARELINKFGKNLILKILRENARNLKDFYNVFDFLWEWSPRKVEGGERVFAVFLKNLKRLDFSSPDALERTLSPIEDELVGASEEENKRNFFLKLRLGLTGKKRGIETHYYLFLLGKEEVERRLSALLEGDF